jgi:sporulation protein YlmC with PRC-barrel domain
MYAATELQRYIVHGMDADVGKVEDTYFDDRQWTVRHLVVDSRHWLHGRRVVIPPAAVRAVDDAHRRLEVKSTRAQVELSPPVDTARPVSRQHHASLYSYYGCPYDWSGGALGRDPLAGVGGGDPHLRSARAVSGYHIRANGSEVGSATDSLDDFLVEIPAWSIRYAVVRSGHGHASRHVLVPPEWITGVCWEGRLVDVGLTREALHGAPRYDPSRPLDRAYETRLREYYATVRSWRRTG